MADSVFQRIAAGDEGAVKSALDRFGGLVWSLARRFTPSPAEAEDAVQEIFISLWKSAGRYDPARASEATFVATIARRRLIDRLRASGARPRTEALEAAETQSDGGAERDGGAAGRGGRVEPGTDRPGGEGGRLKAMRVAIGVVLALAFFAGLVLATLRETQAECEVCVVFGGERVCRTSSAADQETATQMAQATACAVLSNGVTQGMQCRRTPPESVHCGG